ncbi:hypothetical protein ABF86_01155 [Nitrosomonas sp. GH22]|uniref:transposase n=1 Tax=Nitrosomonas sp. GH22 TaxID=153947 RepID=UPI00094543E4|nr:MULTISPECIES: transposase [Nitrosomonas]MXS79403.1 hypothetical protein [Nitrosomonas sp. GH22]
MRKSYPGALSNLLPFSRSWKEFAKSPICVTKPRIVDLFDVFYTVVYMLKTDCQWRVLLGDYPKREMVCAYFSKWKKPDVGGMSALECALKNQI